MGHKYEYEIKGVKEEERLSAEAVARRVVRKAGELARNESPALWLCRFRSTFLQAGLQRSILPVLFNTLSRSRSLLCSHTVHLRRPQQKNVLLQ